MPFSDYRTALVTGASSGIGAAVVERFCREGLEVHALARCAEAAGATGRADRLHPARLGRDRPAGAHAGSPARSSSTSSSTTRASTGRRSSSRPTPEDIDLLVDVNLRAVLHLCRLVVPGMVARDRGHVVNISSIAGAYNFGGNSTYHATKAAVSMLSRQLRIDCLRQTRARHRDLPRPGRDRHLRPCPRRQPRDPRNASSTASSCRRRRTSPTRSPSRSPRRSPSTSATWRSLRRCKCPAAFRRPGPASTSDTRLAALSCQHEGFRSLRDPGNPEFAACCSTGLPLTFVIAVGSWLPRDEPRHRAARHPAHAPAASPKARSRRYVSYHRNVPTLVQLMLWYFGISSLLPDRAAILARRPQRRGDLRDHRPRPVPGRLFQRGPALRPALGRAGPERGGPCARPRLRRSDALRADAAGASATRCRRSSTTASRCSRTAASRWRSASPNSPMP